MFYFLRRISYAHNGWRHICKFGTYVDMVSLSLWMTIYPWNGRGHGHVIRFNFSAPITFVERPKPGPL